MQQTHRLAAKTATAPAQTWAQTWTKTLATCAASALLALATVPAQASLLHNGNFEANALPLSSQGGNYCYLGLSGGSCGAAFSAGFGWGGTAPLIQASSSAWGIPGSLAGFGSQGSGGQVVGIQTTTELSQDLALGAGNYSLQWADAGRVGYAAAHYQVLFGDAVLASYDTQPGDIWALNTLDFSVAGPGTLTFRNLQRSYTLATDGTAFIDGLVLSARPGQVPEPPSLGLVGLALLATLVAGIAAGRRLLVGR